MNLFVGVLFAATFLFVLSSALKEGLTCDACLHCDNCVRLHCTRLQPLKPASSVVSGVPFNHYSWLTTHNAFARLGANSATGSVLLAPMNQEDSITSALHILKIQLSSTLVGNSLLQHSIRGLMLDMYDFENDIWLCHSFGGKCYNYTAFQPAINCLKEIQVFLDANPSEIITIIIEDYVTSPSGFTKVFNAAGLRKFWFPISRMPKNGRDWPTVDDMVKKKQRLVVFTSKSSKEATEGIAYEWNYLVENQYGNGGLKAGSCPNRAESPAMSVRTRSLVLMNYFPDAPDLTQACKYNSPPLSSMMNTCHSVDGNRWPNFIAVDFYKRSDGGGAPEAVDMANAQMICGCASVASRKPNMTFGVCELPKASSVPVLTPTPNGAIPKRTNRGNSTSFATLQSKPFLFWWL